MTDPENPYASPTAASIPLPGDRPLRTEFPAELRRVRLGLSLVYYGICGVLLATICTPFLVALDVMVVLGIAGIMFVLSTMIFVGQALCIAVPVESGAKGLAIAAAVLQLASWAVSLGTSLFESSVGVVGGSLVGGLASLASPICFVLFLRQTARYVGEHAIAARATRTLIVGLIAAAMFVPGMVWMPGFGFAAAGGPVPETAWLAMMGIGGLMMLAAFLMYANTITYLRKAIRL